MRNPRVKTLFDRWRKVWLLSVDRNRKLREMLDRLREVYLLLYFINIFYLRFSNLKLERLKDFDFEEWRKRYMNWIKDNRARIMDFFRRQDKDHDGKISRDEFIDGILQSSKLIIFS
jgi:dystonin